jgi:hypothetical protein
MQMKTEYEKFAVVCEGLITQVKTDHHRRVLAEMAETWRKLAAEADKHETKWG